MRVTAVLRGTRLSAQKGRLVADQIRGLPVDRALNILAFSPKKGAVIIKKVLESAIANAEHNDGADIDELKVATIYVDKGSIAEAFHVHVRKVVATELSSLPAISQSLSETKRKEHGTENSSNRFPVERAQELDFQVVCQQQEFCRHAAEDIKVRDFLKKKLAHASVGQDRY